MSLEYFPKGFAQAATSQAATSQRLGLAFSEAPHAAIGPSAAARTDSGSYFLGNLTFGKMTLGKIPLGSTLPLGINPLENYLTSFKLLDFVFFVIGYWYILVYIYIGCDVSCVKNLLYNSTKNL